MECWQILLICICGVLILFVLSIVFYRQFFKRFWDIVLSGLAIVILSPVFLILIIAGTIAMKGNPFFIQKRPGKNEEIFNLIKFRSMNCEKDDNGNLLPDDLRLVKYGKFLRSTSLDELPELFNIFIGNMSIVGPRPLLVQYLPIYNDQQRQRHDVRPGLTGYAQCHGRNGISWTEKFKLDVYYVKNISFFGDVKILFMTALCVFKRDGINQEGNATIEDFNGDN